MFGSNPSPISPPAEGNKDVKQLQEDLPQEKADNEIEPNKKKEALQTIIADYNHNYGTNHSISTFDLYYQGIQQRIKDQKYTNTDYAYKNKIDVLIVVDIYVLAPPEFCRFVTADDRQQVL